MKNPLFLFLVCFALFPCFSQTGTAIYKKEVIFPKDMYGDMEKTNPGRYKDFKAFDKKIQDAASQVEFELKFSEGEAVFQPREMMGTENVDIELGIGPNGGIHYSNQHTGEKLWEMNGFGQNFLISMPNIEWNITSETKIITGYECRKATGEKIMKGSRGEVKIPIEAWFAPKIPVNFGPIGYSGLPGLIVSLKMQREHYYVSSIKLGQKKMSINRPTRGKKVTFEEFQAIGREVMDGMRPD